MSKILFSIAVAYIIYFVFRMLYNDIKLYKLHKAMSELHKMPIDEWESKWGKFVQNEYSKCNDPHRQEVEENMKFFRKELEELKKDENANIQQ